MIDGLKSQGIETIEGLEGIIGHPVDTVIGIKGLLLEIKNNPELLEQIGFDIVEDIQRRIDKIADGTAYETGYELGRLTVEIAGTAAGAKLLSKIPGLGKLVEAVGSKTVSKSGNLSASNVKHMSKHIPSEFEKQAVYLSDELLVKKLSKTTFFNPNWTQEQIISATEEAYNMLRSQGKTGLQSYKINGDEIMVFIKPDGTFDTAYGLHRLTIDFFRK